MAQSKPWELTRATIERHLSDPGLLSRARDAFEASLPEPQRKHVEALLRTTDLSYRDGLLIQLAYGLALGVQDLTIRHRGGRSVAGKLGRFLEAAHIPAVKDAYQNIAKNTPTLTRGNVPAFDEFLRWASEPERASEQLEAAFEYACARVAATARPVAPMPELDLSKLSFAAVSQLLEELFSTGSGGAYEQFAIAALLHALIEQATASGYRVETKSLHASDKSSRAAGDVQILAGQLIIEAFEVTANLWSEKLPAAGKIIRDHDLSRLHIVARAPEADRRLILDELTQHAEDVSVLDVRAFTSSLVASLRRRDRALALLRLYELLDRHQPDVERVNAYVAALVRHRLVASA